MSRSVKIGLSFAVVAILVSFSALPVQAAEPTPPTIVYYDVNTGSGLEDHIFTVPASPFTIDFVVLDLPNAGTASANAIDLWVEFDPLHISTTAASTQEGDIWIGGVPFPPFVDVTNGLLSYTYTKLGGVMYGSGTMVTVTFSPETSSVTTEVYIQYLELKGSPEAGVFVTHPYTITPSPTDTPTDTPSFTPTYTHTPTFTYTDTFTETPTFTNTHTFTNTATFTNTGTFTNTATVTNTLTPTDTPTITDTPTKTSTPTNTPTITDTFIPTDTSTYTYTPTVTDTPTNTPTFTNTHTFTPTFTNTFTPTPLPCEMLFGQTFVGSIDSPSDIDSCYFQAVVGSRITIVARGSNFFSRFRPQVSLLDPDGGQLIGFGQDTIFRGRIFLLRDFTLTKSGVYKVSIRGANSTTGAYRLKLRGTHPTINELVGGSIGTLGEEDVYTLLAVRNTLLEVELTNSFSLDAYCDIVGPDMNSIGNGTLITTSVIKSGEHEVIVIPTGGTTGSYTMRYVGTPPTGSGNVTSPD